MHSLSFKLDLDQILIEAEELILRLKKVGLNRGLVGSDDIAIPVIQILATEHSK